MWIFSHVITLRLSDLKVPNRDSAQTPGNGRIKSCLVANHGI